MPHNSSEGGFIVKDISLPQNFTPLRYILATKIIRFDTIRLFLWFYMKDRVYADKPSTLEHFKTNIRQVMDEIRPNMCVYCWKIIQQRMLVFDNFHVKMLYTYTHFSHMFFEISVGFVPTNCLNAKYIWNVKYPKHNNNQLYSIQHTRYKVM